MSKKTFPTHCIPLSVRAICTLALAGPLFLFGGSEALAENCKHVHGRFVNQVDATADADCTLPGPGGCVRGNVIGGLRGDFLATNTTAFPADAEVPDVFFFVGDFVLTTKTGDIEMIETGAIGFSKGSLGDVVTIVGGTGEWTDASGRLRVYGNLIPGVLSDVTYDGDVCGPQIRGHRRGR